MMLGADRWLSPSTLPRTNTHLDSWTLPQMGQRSERPLVDASSSTSDVRAVALLAFNLLPAQSCPTSFPRAQVTDRMQTQAAGMSNGSLSCDARDPVDAPGHGLLRGRGWSSSLAPRAWLPPRPTATRLDFRGSYLPVPATCSVVAYLCSLLRLTTLDQCSSPRDTGEQDHAGRTSCLVAIPSPLHQHSPHARKRRVSDLNDSIPGSLPGSASSNASGYGLPQSLVAGPSELDVGLGPSQPPPQVPSPVAKKGRTNTPWTPAEEQRLKALRDAGSSWSEIAKTFPTRTEGSVKKHWYKDMHYAEFAEDEVSNFSAALLQAIKDYENNKWKVIGQKVGKPAKACEQFAKEQGWKV
nr:hypothetical protein CFP56_03963 [Quercus suber]